MEAKDWLTIIVLIATIFSSHWLASKQTRKNSKVKWIDDLRLEVANLISLSQQVERRNVNTLFPFSKSGFVVTMLLDQDNAVQNKLILEVQAFGLFMSEKYFDVGQMPEYSRRVSDITNLTKYIIYLESKKI